MQLLVVLSLGTGMQTSQPGVEMAVFHTGRSNIIIKMVYCNLVSICTFLKVKLGDLNRFKAVVSNVHWITCTCRPDILSLCIEANQHAVK